MGLSFSYLFSQSISSSSPSSPHTLIGSTFILAYIAYEHFPGFLKRIGPSVKKAFWGTDRIDTLFAGIVTVLSSLLFVPLYNSRFIPEHDGKVWSGGSCWADLPIHMHMAQAFLSGRNQDVSWGGMHSPIFAGEPMAYPFLPDFHAAVLVKLGTTIRWAMMLPGFLLAIALMVLLVTFTRRLTKSRLGGIFAILITIGAGGMGGWNLSLRDGFWNSIDRDTAQNDVTGDGKIVWFAFIPHVLLPQRGANFAYPMVLTVLTLVWKATDMRKGEAVSHIMRREMLILAAAFSGALPLIQAHAFIGLAVIIGTIFILDIHKWLADPRILVSWIYAGIVAIGVGYPQMGLFKHQVESGSGGHFLNYGWWYKNHDFGREGGIRAFFYFWWMSLGPALPLFLLCIALILWELGLAQQLATSIHRDKVGPNTWKEIYNAVVNFEPPAVPAALPPPTYITSNVTPPSRTPVSELISSNASEAGDDLNTSSDVPYTTDSVTNNHNNKNGNSRSHKFQVQGDKKQNLTASATGIDSDDDDNYEPVNQTTGAGARPKLDVMEPPKGTRQFAAYQHSGTRTTGNSASSSIDPLSTYRDPKINSYFSEHLWAVTKGSIANDFGINIDSIFNPLTYAWADFDRQVFHLNTLSLHGRSLDLLKLLLGAFGVFLLGNGINFQPWDRDNCKLFYIWVFINSCIVGSLFAAPFEYLAAVGPGVFRMASLNVIFDRKEYSKVLYASSEYDDHSTLQTIKSASSTGKPLPSSSSSTVKSSSGSILQYLTMTKLSTLSNDTKLKSVSTIGAIGTIPALLLLSLTGFMMIYREFGLYHVLLDEDQIAVGEFIKNNIPPKAVFVHKDVHITPAGCLAGRPTLVAYNGWMWSHGYNYYERDRDRNGMLENALKDSDPHAYGLLRRWGVRYVLGEWLPRHHRPSEQAYREAVAEGRTPPAFDQDMYLDGNLKRIFSAGRYDVLEVQGYSFPPT